MTNLMGHLASMAMHHGRQWIEIHDAVAEYIAAVEESRAATQAFANDGQPENWIRYEASEARIIAAHARMKGEAP